MIEAIDYFIDSDTVWALVEHEGRYCYFGIKADELPDGEINEEMLQTVVDERGFDPAILPHIEDTDEILQDLWNKITESENCMVFIDDPKEIDDEWKPWEDFKISQEEYEARLDKAIEEYRLEDVITKNEDECTLYACFGDLMSSFSGTFTEIPEGLTAV